LIEEIDDRALSTLSNLPGPSGTVGLPHLPQDIG
jgi:hypothetical protein